MLRNVVVPEIQGRNEAVFHVPDALFVAVLDIARSLFEFREGALGRLEETRRVAPETQALSRCAKTSRQAGASADTVCPAVDRSMNSVRGRGAETDWTKALPRAMAPIMCSGGAFLRSYSRPQSTSSP